MKIDMELKPGDIVLLKVLACVLILFFMGRFLIFPGLEKHQDLVSAKEDAESTRQEMQFTIDKESTYEEMITAQQENLKKASEGYYDLMANREVDELVTGLVLQHDLFPVSLNIADPVPGVPEAYQSMETAQSTDSSENESTQEKNEKTKDAADAELDGTSDSDSTDSSDGAGDSGSDTTYLQYVNTTTVTLALQGSEERIRELLDDIAKNYPGIQVRSFDMQENTYVDSNLQAVGQMNCNCVLAVYTCGELTNANTANTEGETTN